MSRLNLTSLRKMKAEQNKIAVLTAYDASFSHVLEQAGVDVILVGVRVISILKISLFW